MNFNKIQFQYNSNFLTHTHTHTFVQSRMRVSEIAIEHFTGCQPQWQHHFLLFPAPTFQSQSPSPASNQVPQVNVKLKLPLLISCW